MNETTSEETQLGLLAARAIARQAAGNRRPPLERAALAIRRAIDKELPELDPADRRSCLVAVIEGCTERLMEFDLMAEKNRGVAARRQASAESAVTAELVLDKAPGDDDALRRRAALGDYNPPCDAEAAKPQPVGVRPDS